eukprot:Phypoly_transcript_01430.p1 GENE.Phypoly_transcript_01430~~Phypoly_transcript_01430.p1  ORF type:complete len:1044 (+),score=126.49 Phypoly_transcript_01430:316-3132(+)
MAFISSVSIALAKNKNKLSTATINTNPIQNYFREAWVFSAAMAIVEACTSTSSTPTSPSTSSTLSTNSVPSTPTKTPPKPPAPPPLQRFLSVRAQSSSSNLTSEKPATPNQGSQAAGGTSNLSLTSEANANSSKFVGDSITQEYVDCLIADLIYQARSKLDILGKEFGLIPKNTVITAEGSEEQQKQPTAPLPSTPSFSNPVLRDAMQSEAAFDKLYIDMTQRALGLYASANRVRSVVRLNFDMANLHYHRSRWEKAEPLFKSVSSAYGNDGWYALEYPSRALLTECERRLAHIHGYISDCLALLAPSLPLSTSERLLYVEQLLKHAADLSPPLVRDSTPIFAVTLSFLANKYTLGTTIQAQCNITSTLPKSLTIDKVTLYLAPYTAPTTPQLPRDSSSSSLPILRKESPRNSLVLTNSTDTPTPTPGPPSSKSATPSTLPPTSDDGIIITLQNVTLQPGLNSFLLENEAKLKGQFISTSVALELGQLSFYHQLHYDRPIINVTESTSRVTLSAKPPVSLLLKVVQKVLITISTGPEPLTAATLSVRSATGVQILEGANDDDSTTIIIVRHMNSDDTPGAIIRCQTATLVAGKLVLSTLSANQFIEVYIPIIANNVQPCVHQLRAELVHEKRTKEIFFLATSVALPFAHAFCATAVCTPLHDPSAGMGPCMLVQAVLTSTVGAPLTILNYVLKGPIEIQHDSNAHHLKNTTINPNQQTSFVFCISTPPQTSPQQDISLEITFSLPSLLSMLDSVGSGIMIPPMTVHTFSTPLTLSLPSPQYIIETRNPPTAYLAQPIQFELMISQVTSSSTLSTIPSTPNGSINGQTSLSSDMLLSSSFLLASPSVVLFEIEEDSLWLVSGKRRATIQLTSDTPSTVSCRIRPISAGIIPVPKVRLMSVPHASFSVTSKVGPYVQVFPEPITSECTAITDDGSMPLNL